MQQNIELTDFTSGELSPRMKGRTDYKGYFDGCDTLLNMVVMPQGGSTRRPGTLYVANNAVQTAACLLLPFQFSTQQAYVLEFTHLKARVYANNGVVLDGGNPVDIVTPYTSGDLGQLQICQSADTLFIVHPNYPPASLTRSSNTAWTYSPLAFLDGPYLDINATTTTLTPSGLTGAINIVASSTDGINNNQGFLATDVDRFLRIKMFSLWAWCIITAVTDPTHISATVQGKVNNGAAAELDGAPWQPNTQYVTGQVVSNGAPTLQYYIATTGGISGTTNGPQGQCSDILDGTVIWSALSARNSTGWVQSTIYNAGDIVLNTGNGNYYQALNGGKSSSGGTGPAGMGTVVDAAITWSYLPPYQFPATTTSWQLGAWGAGQGYPYAVRFWQQRLCFGGSNANPNQIVGSQTGDFTNMAPTMADGTVQNSSALNWTIDDDQVNAIRWLISAGSAQAMQLGVGTMGAEHVLQGASSQGVVTPTSVQSYPETNYGSASNCNPLRIGKAVMFVDRSGRFLEEWAFYWQQNGYVAIDKLQPSEHISRAADGSNQALNGIKRLAYQQVPYKVIWAIRNDGMLLSFTYDRDQQVFAPARHALGGDYYGGYPIVESLTVIPSPDGTYDQLWLSVLRTINGTKTRTIEVMSRYFDGQMQDQAVFSDCALSSSLSYPNATVTITGLENVNDEEEPPYFAGAGTAVATAAIFGPGDVGTKYLRINGGLCMVTGYTDAETISIQTIQPLFNLAPAAANVWSYTQLEPEFTGLNYLAGETVTICGDGAAMGEVTVANDGSVTLPSNGRASLATIGLPYGHVLVTMPWEPVRAAAASSQGRMKRIDTLYMRIDQTGGFDYGRRKTDPMTGKVTDLMEPFNARKSGQLAGQPPPLVSKIERLKVPGGFDEEGQLIFSGSDPTPFTLLSIFAKGEVAEIGQAA